VTGSQHYRDAERLLAALDETVQTSEAMASCIAQAQVHATLALVAAQVHALILATPEEQRGAAITNWQMAMGGTAMSGAL
jgi:hypothetical protein